MSAPKNAGQTVFVENRTASPVPVDFGRIVVTENWGRLFVSQGDGEPLIVLREAYPQLINAIAHFTDAYPYPSLATLQPDTERAEPVADVVRGVWGRCEALEDEAYAKLESDKLTDHERGFWRGLKLAAKSIRRSTELPQTAPTPQARDITVQEAAEVPEVKELIEATSALAGQAAHVVLGARFPQVDISAAALNLEPLASTALRAIAAMQKGG